MEIAVIGLVVVIGLQFAYIIYTDKENRKERERMQLKIMAKDIIEYKDAVAPLDKDTEEQRDEYLPVEDFDLETLVKARDNM